MNTTTILYDIENKKMSTVVTNKKDGITYKNQLEGQSIEDFYKHFKVVCESKKMPCFTIEVNCFSEDK